MGRSVVLSLCVLTLALGCSGSNKKASDNNGSVPGSQVGSPVTDSASNQQSSGGANPGPAVATGNTSDGSTPLKIEVRELRRSNGVVSLNFSVTNTSATGTIEWTVKDFFDDGTSNDAAAGDSANGDTVDGVYLIDGVNKKRYPVARDTKGHCACSGNLAFTSIGPGQNQTFSATFGAPPADVRTVDVTIPHLATFANVPLH